MSHMPATVYIVLLSGWCQTEICVVDRRVTRTSAQLRSYKLLSLTCTVLTTTQPSYLHNLITVQPLCSTLHHWSRSSIYIIFSTNNRSFLQYASPRLWNELPVSLLQPRTNLSNSGSPSPLRGTSSIDSIDSPLSSSVTPHSFFPGL